MAAQGELKEHPRPEPHTHVRAYLEYFRDLGVYEFYRHSNPSARAFEIADAVAQRDSPASSREATQQQARALPVAATPAPVPLPDLNLPSVTEGEIPKPASLNDRLPLPAIRVPAAQRAAALEAIAADIGDCTRCPLAYAGRRKIVFGDGDPNAQLMFVGEGPGADEDEQGIPFVGKSGQLLNNMIGAMGLSRQQVYIANIVKCRPPANRAPEPIEANTCTQFLARQIDVIQPAYIVALGSTAASYLLGTRQSLASLRGHWHEVRGAKAIVTFHPAYLLRDPRQKGEAWKDLQLVMSQMGLKGSRS